MFVVRREGRVLGWGTRSLLAAIGATVAATLPLGSSTVQDAGSHQVLELRSPEPAAFGGPTTLNGKSDGRTETDTEAVTGWSIPGREQPPNAWGAVSSCWPRSSYSRQYSPYQLATSALPDSSR